MEREYEIPLQAGVGAGASYGGYKGARAIERGIKAPVGKMVSSAFLKRPLAEMKRTGHSSSSFLAQRHAKLDAFKTTASKRLKIPKRLGRLGAAGAVGGAALYLMNRKKIKAAMPQQQEYAATPQQHYYQ